MVESSKSSSASDVKTVLKSLKKDKQTEIKDAVGAMNSHILSKTYQSDALKSAQGFIKFFQDVPASQSLEVFTNAVSHLDADTLKECHGNLKPGTKKEKKEYASTEAKAEAVANKMLTVIGQIDAEIKEAEKVKYGVVMNFLKHYYNFSMKGSRCDNSILDGLLEARLRELDASRSVSSTALGELTKMMSKTHL